MKRCTWAKNELAVAYHDTEWGVPVRDDRTLFEFLILEGAQAGLSWDTVLKKRENYRQALDGFDPVKIARYTEKRREKLMLNPGLVRNRLKIESTVINAKAFLKVQQEFDGFEKYIWRFVDGEPITNTWKSMKSVPASTKLSDAISKDLKGRGFTFVGSTIVYAYMQAVGLVNDHLLTCFRHGEV